MWIFLSDSFFSIVEDARTGKLWVRARQKGDIARVFPGYRERHTPAADYSYRILVHRNVVAKKIAAEVRKIEYPNFKDSVLDESRHWAYLQVWTAMFEWARHRRPWLRKPILDDIPEVGEEWFKRARLVEPK